MDKNAKKRSDNWSQEEKDILRQLISASSGIIESKENSTNVNQKKIKEWKEITNRLNNITNKQKTENQVKTMWKRMKLAAKASVSQHRRLARQTGGGEKPPSPTEEEEAIMSIAPHDFIEESNPFDSDAVIGIGIYPDFEKKDELSSTLSHTNKSNNIISLNHDDITESGQSISGAEPCSSNITDILNTTSSNLECIPNEEQNIRQSKKNMNVELKQKIVESNINMKKKSIKMAEELHLYNIKNAKRTLEMMEELHNYNLKTAKIEMQKSGLEFTIGQLKVKKLELEIAQLQKQL